MGDKVLEIKAGLASMKRLLLGFRFLSLRNNTLGRPETLSLLLQQLPTASNSPDFLKHMANW